MNKETIFEQMKNELNECKDVYDIDAIYTKYVTLVTTEFDQMVDDGDIPVELAYEIFPTTLMELAELAKDRSDELEGIGG